MHRNYLLIVTALGEGGIGLLLLVWPPLPMALLLGVEQGSPEVFFFARIAGAALLALSIACWAARNEYDRPAQRYLLLGVLFYDVAATGILTYSGVVMSPAGIALWPAVGLHAALAFWSGAAVCSKSEKNRR
jgi:hypothetical protein